MRKYVHWWHFIWVLLISLSGILRILLCLWYRLSKLFICRICCGVWSALNLLVISYRIWRHMHHITVVMLLIRMHVWHWIWIRWIHRWILTHWYVHWRRRKHIGWIIRRMLIIVIFIAKRLFFFRREDWTSLFIIFLGFLLFLKSLTPSSLSLATMLTGIIIVLILSFCYSAVSSIIWVLPYLL